MTQVSFETVLKAYRARDTIAAAFCTDSILKKLYGKVDLISSSVNSSQMYDCSELIKKVPGRLHVFVDLDASNTVVGRDNPHETIVTALVELMKRKYVSITLKRGLCNSDIERLMTGFNSGLVFVFRYQTNPRCNIVFYRRALFNGHNVVDMLRAVCGPADVSEAELDRVRREATREEWDVGNVQWWRMAEEEPEAKKGVWFTKWWSAAVTKQL